MDTLVTTQFASETHGVSSLPRGCPWLLPVEPLARNTHVEQGVPAQSKPPIFILRVICTARSIPAVVLRSMHQFLQMSYWPATRA